MCNWELDYFVLEEGPYVLINHIISAINRIHDDIQQQYDTRLEDMVDISMILFIILYTYKKN